MARWNRNRLRQRPSVPKQLLQNLAQDLVSMIENEESYSMALELVDQLPAEFQAIFIENLSSVHEVKLARFFWLIIEEYTGEIQKAAQRAIEKYRLVGLAVDDYRIKRQPVPGRFFKALASRTRLLGQVSLVMAWEQENKLLDVWYFGLKFGPEGIRRYLRVTDLSIPDFLEEHEPDEIGMVELSLKQAQALLQQAYFYNQAYQVPAGRPVFRYADCLKDRTPVNFSDSEVQALNLRLTEEKLNPHLIVNAYLVAEKNSDWGLIYDLSSRDSAIRRYDREAYQELRVAESFEADRLYILSAIERKIIRQKTAEVEARVVISEDSQVEERRYTFKLVLEESAWRIAQTRILRTREIDEDDPDNPLNYEVYCALYEVAQETEVQELLEDLPEVEVIEDIEFGIHYRWANSLNLLEEGINLAENVFGEFILTGDELLVTAKDREDLNALCSLMEDRLPESIHYQQQYYVDVSLVYALLSGEFSSFEELLGELAVEEPEERLPVMIATYQVANLEPVLKRIRSFTVFEFDSPEGVKCFYEFERIRFKAGNGQQGEGFVAEYRVTPQQLTVTTFGQDYLNLVCGELERGLQDSLRFLDIQAPDEGFALLAIVGKPAFSKEAKAEWQKEELNRWMQTALPVLDGMTPMEAKETLPGRQLLWRLFKNMKNLQQDLQRKGLNLPIDYREYIRMVSLGE